MLLVASLVVATCFYRPSHAQSTAPVVGLGQVSAVYDLEVMPPYLLALERELWVFELPGGALNAPSP